MVKLLQRLVLSACGVSVWMAIALLMLGIQPALAEEGTESFKIPLVKGSHCVGRLCRLEASGVDLGGSPGSNTAKTQTRIQIPRLRDLKRPAMTVQEWVSQTPSPIPDSPLPVQVTGAKLNPTDTGIEVILETSTGAALQPLTRSEGNSYIADIPNAQLRLPSGNEFREDNPASGINRITVTNQDANTIRVTVTGTASVPSIELFDSDEGLIFGVTTVASSTQQGQQPQTQQPEQVEPGSETPPQTPLAPDESIELLVTGEQDTGYNVPDASTATRTDTPIRDIPQSIQVVPRQVLEDRNVQNLTQAVETVAGVIDAGSFYGAPAGSRLIRGFGGYDQAGNFRNGFRDVDYVGVTPIGTIEQVEVLRGPASVLFGALEPGGIINVITRQPLDEPFYQLAFEAGNYGLYQPSIDLSGPLTADDTLLYRFIASYRGAESYQNFVDTSLVTIAPSITLNLGDRTSLNLYYEYAGFTGDPPLNNDLPLLSDDSFPPRNVYPGYPDLSFLDIDTQRFGYTFNHEFSDNWQIRNNVAVALIDLIDDRAYPGAIENDRFLTNFTAYDASYRKDNYFGQIDLLGKFDTGSISHQLLVGFDVNRFVDQADPYFISSDLPPLDIQNPNYDIPSPDFVLGFAGSDGLVQSYGAYLQDQIAFSDNLKLLIGGRYDWVSYENEIRGDGIDQAVQSDGAFSPRIGLVYQPSDTVSLYASYSRSFRQTTGFNSDGETFEPTRGTQYEIGVRTDFLNGRLSANLAAYHLTKTNITTPDPDNPLFSVQTGEARSQGIELDITGEILPGWNIIASYAYTDAVVTEDNTIPEGNRLANVPEHQASLWTTYTIQEGDFRGLGFGLGLFYLGARQGSFDLATPFTLDSDFRTDAAIYYRRGRFNAAINIRNLLDTDNATFSFSRSVVQRDTPFTIVGSISWTF